MVVYICQIFEERIRSPFQRPTGSNPVFSSEFLPLSLLGSSAGAVFRRRTPFAFLSWLFLTWWMIAAVAIRMVAVTERLYYERCARRGLSFAACRLGVAALRLVPCWGWGWPSGLIIFSHRRP